MERDRRSPSLELRFFGRRVAVSLAGFALAAAGFGRVPPPHHVVRWEPLAIVSAWGSPTVPAEIGRIRVPENRTSGSGRRTRPSRSTRRSRRATWTR